MLQVAAVTKAAVLVNIIINFGSRRVEAECSKWQVLVEQLSGTSSTEFDNQTLAVLRGRLVRSVNKVILIYNLNLSRNNILKTRERA